MSLHSLKFTIHVRIPHAVCLAAIVNVGLIVAVALSALVAGITSIGVSRIWVIIVCAVLLLVVWWISTVLVVPVALRIAVVLIVILLAVALVLGLVLPA